MAAKKKYPKKPTAPKSNASLSSQQSYREKMLDWQNKCAEVDSHNQSLDDAKAYNAQLKKLTAKNVGSAKITAKGVSIAGPSSPKPKYKTKKRK